MQSDHQPLTMIAGSQNNIGIAFSLTLVAQ